ncbi:hypothetical protein [Streptomyces sp. B93]|uniref:hypothetical protein n=1 Tax=Streptomyces sp. B93 TaxID=2824875 RepID=UPI001B37F202|nr:hypothetical protein [Streptomyces sp. B93]MBQ1090644.1 hypothetical protein [Streptomyces sp. B93]
MAARYRPMTPRQLAEDEHRTDHERGRRYCRVHRDQQMIPTLPGLDVCPGCGPASENREHRVSKSKKGVDAAKGRRDREDSKEAGATTPAQRQEQVSTNLGWKAHREGRFYGD